MTAELILILGCTACGKGKVAFKLAQQTGGQILSIDSMKVYRRMDIGTAKAGLEQRRLIKHHLIDVVEPYESFSAGKFVELADEVIAAAQRKDSPIIAVGGTAMYIRALIEGIFAGPPADAKLRWELKRQAAKVGSISLHERLRQVDPEGAKRIHPHDLKRLVRALEVYELTGEPITSFHQHFYSGNLRHNWKIFGLRRDKEDNNQRINQRVKKMVQDGLVEEVKSLLAEPKGLSKQAAQAVGYAEIISHLQGEIPLEDAIEKIKINSRRLAKHQRTWFRGFKDVYWLEVGPEDEAEQIVGKILAYQQNNR